MNNGGEIQSRLAAPSEEEEESKVNKLPKITKLRLILLVSKIKFDLKLQDIRLLKAVKYSNDSISNLFENEP